MSRDTPVAFRSNCLVEAIKLKIKHKGSKILYIKPDINNGVPHFVVIDGENIYDFHQIETLRSWFNMICFYGYIRKRTLKAFKKLYKIKG